MPRGFNRGDDIACERSQTYKRLFEHLRAPRRVPALKFYFTETKALAKTLLQSFAVCCIWSVLVKKMSYLCVVKR